MKLQVRFSCVISILIGITAFFAAANEAIGTLAESLGLYYQIPLTMDDLHKLHFPPEVITAFQQFNITSSPILYVSSNATTLPDNTSLNPGFTLISEVNLQNFLQQISAFVPVPKKLLQGTLLQANIPFSYSKPQDMTVHIGAKPTQQPEETLKMSGLLRTLGLDTMPLGDTLLQDLDGIAVTPTTYGVDYSQGVLRYQLAAKVALFGMQNISMQLHIEPGTKGSKPRMALKFSIPSPHFGLGDLSEHLTPFDQTVTLKNPAITFANYENAEEGTCDGIFITSIANFGAPFNTMLAPDGNQDQVTVAVKIPRTLQSADDVSVRVTSSALHADKLCLNDLSSKLGVPFTVGPMQSMVDQLCMTNVTTSVRLIESDSAFEIHGDTSLFGATQTSTLYIQKRQSGIGLSLVSDSAGSNALNLSSLNSSLSQFDQFGTLKNYTFAFSNWDNPDDLLGFGSMTKGFSMTGTMEFSGYLGKFLQLFGLQEERFLLKMPAGLNIVDGFTIEIEKDIDTSMGGDFLQLKKLLLGLKFVGETPPLPGATVQLDGVATLPGCEPRNVVLEGTISAAATELTGALVQAEDTENRQTTSTSLSIAHTPVTVNKPIVSISLAQGALVGFGGGGDLKIGNKELEIYTKVDVANPKKMAIMADAHKVSLTDILNFQLAIFGKAGLNLQLPPIFTFNDFTLHYAPEVVTLADSVVIRQGWGARGTVTLLNTTFDVEVTFGLTGITVKGIGDKPLKLAPGFTISDTTGTKGPLLDMELNFTNQQALLSGKITIGPDGFIANSGQIVINNQGLNATSTTNLLGIQANVGATLPLKSLQKVPFPAPVISIVINNPSGATPLGNLVGNHLQSLTAPINNEASSVMGSIEHVVGDIESACNKIHIPGCSAFTSIFNTAQQTASALTTAIQNLQQTGITKITVSAPASVLSSNASPQAAVQYMLAGQQQTLNIPVALHNTQAAAKAIAQAIFAANNPQHLLDSLKSALQDLKNIGLNAGNAIKAVAQEAAQAAKEAAQQAAAKAKQAVQATKAAAQQAVNASRRKMMQAEIAARRAYAIASSRAAGAGAAAAQAAYKAAQQAYQQAQQAYHQAMSTFNSAASAVEGLL